MKIISNTLSVISTFDLYNILPKIIGCLFLFGITFWISCDLYQKHRFFEGLLISGHQTSGRVIEKDYNRSSCYLTIQFEAVSTIDEGQKNIVETINMSRFVCSEINRNLSIFYDVIEPSNFVVEETRYKQLFSHAFAATFFLTASIIFSVSYILEYRSQAKQM